MENKQKRLDLVSKAYTTMQKNNETIHILDTEVLDMATQNDLLDMQNKLDTTFDLSYEIMADACDIIANKTLEGNNRDSLTGDDLDFYADADGQANVYTSVQLSYLNVDNESEISNLMQDESITSIAQACNVWYVYKVVEACEMLKDYILNN